MRSHDDGRRAWMLAALVLGACATAPAREATTQASAVRSAGWAVQRGWTGHWAGTWRTMDRGFQMSGSAEIDVLDRGELRGTLHAVGYEGRLSGQVRPTGRAHAAVYVAEQQITLLLDGPCVFEQSPRTAIATLEVHLRHMDVGQVRVEMRALPAR